MVAPIPLSVSAGDVDSPGIYVSAIQWAYKLTGYRPGEIDGKAGPIFDRTTVGFQLANKLPETGVVGRAEWALINRVLDVVVREGREVPDRVILPPYFAAIVRARDSVDSTVEPSLWAMFPHEIEIPRSYLQTVADANNWFSDVAFGIDHEPYRVEVFDRIEEIDPDVYDLHYLANGTLGVKGVRGFHSARRAPGDDDIDRYAVSDATLPRYIFEMVVNHEHNEGTKNPQVGTLHRSRFDPDEYRFDETNDGCQGSYTVAPNGIRCELYNTNQWLRYDDEGENPARNDCAWRFGMAPLCLSADDFGPQGWGLFYRLSTNSIYTKTGASVPAALTPGRSAHARRRIEQMLPSLALTSSI